MDRVLVRSFRAHDLAERGLKDLARSRLDTTREVVFQPLGARFFEAREDVVRLANLFREDAYHAPAGNFARLTLRVEPQLADKLSALEPRAVESRLEEAARNAILRELPRAQGAYVVRFEPSAREGLEPVAHVYLSSRRTDGGPLPALTRDDARRFEAAWNREVERAFNLARGQAHGLERGPAQDRASAPAPAAHHLQQEWSRASARLFAVYSDRLAGKATQKELAEAAGQARAARMAWSREAGPAVDLRNVGTRQVFDEVRLKIEGGNRYLSGPLEAQSRTLLEAAASRAAGLPDEKDKRLAVVAWPAGRDLHATVYFNQRSQPGRPPGSIEPELLRAALEARLPEEIRHLAPSLDPAAVARADELGRVEARIQEKAPEPERASPVLQRPEDRGRAVTPAVVVRLDRTAQHDARPEPIQLQTAERDWASERILSVHMQLPTGADQLERLDLGHEEAAQVIQRAIDRAYPFLEREGIRNNFLYSVRGKALDVQILVPERLGWTRDQLRSPQSQRRFLTRFHQALAQVGPTRTGRTREPLPTGLVRGVVAARQVPQMVRQAEQDPERAAKHLVRAAFNKLSEALPKPFRAMQGLARMVSRFRSRDE